MNKKQPNLNENIKAKELFVVFPDGSRQKMSTYTALLKARELGQDLLVISPSVDPPVAKILDYGQYQFEQKKKQKLIKKNQQVQETKEIKFSPNTEEHDYKFKCRHAIDFLKDGHKVKASVVFKGREAQHSDLGVVLLKKLIADTCQYGTIEGNPRVEGRAATVTILPIKGNKFAEQKL